MSIKITECPIAKVKPYENNPRINDAAVDVVADSIREFGWRQPIVVDPEYVIICGHTRLRAALKLELNSVPVHIADLPPEKVKALRIADNQSASLAEWDMDLLPLEIAALQEMNYDLSHLGFDNDALDKMLQSANGEPEDTDEVAPTELETVQPEALKLIEESDRVLVLSVSEGGAMGETQRALSASVGRDAPLVAAP